MKPVRPLLFFYCFFYCLSGPSANAQQEGRSAWLQLYAAKDTGKTWLVFAPTQAAANPPACLGLKVLRRLSAECIILKGERKTIQSLYATAVIFPASNNWKLSPRLLSHMLHAPLAGAASFYIMADSIPALKKRLASAGNIRVLYENKHLLLLQAPYPAMQQLLLPDERISFIDLADQRPMEEAAINGFDYTLNRVNQLHQVYPAYRGSNTIVSVKENMPDTMDIDLRGRYHSTSAASATLSPHATAMATIIAGAGNSFYTANGVAGAAGISSASFDILLPEADSFYLRYGIALQNHSYGTGIEDFYGADAAAYDASVNSNASLLHVFSAGNAGSQAPASGPYAGLVGFANLTGSFKMAKNILTVGATDSFGITMVASSKGPAFDGRVKPELQAYGEDGSSGAAALVSGTALVLQDIYRQQHGGILPDAALLKAVLLNSARNSNKNGIDFYSGYGMLDACRAAEIMQTEQYFSGSVRKDSSQAFTLAVPPGAKNLKVLLAWTDIPAAPNALTALVNDLDLSVTCIPTAQQWLPWVLNAAPHKDSLLLPASRRRDSLNNVELVTIDDPVPGAYMLSVNAFRLASSAQNFFIAYQWDTAGRFKWSFPLPADNLLPGRKQVLRWNSNISDTATLEYRYIGSSNWQPVSSHLQLTPAYTQWQTPDTNAVMSLRMTVGSRQFTTDSFTVSAPPTVKVGYNCPDALLLYWPPVPGARYQVYQLGSQYMQPLQLTADTAIVITKPSGNSNWFSVAPVWYAGKTGLRSPGFDYTTQGVGCYIKSFTADLEQSNAQLKLQLGTTYLIKQISLEKEGGNGSYRTLQVFGPPLQLQYGFTNSKLVQGVNRYRVRIELVNGSIIYSEPEVVNYLGNLDYLVYPNPVTRPGSLHVLSAQLTNPVFCLFDVYGRRLMKRRLFNLSETISINWPAGGIYFYTIQGNNGITATGRLLVQ